MVLLHFGGAIEAYTIENYLHDVGAVGVHLNLTVVESAVDVVSAGLFEFDFHACRLDVHEGGVALYFKGSVFAMDVGNQRFVGANIVVVGIFRHILDVARIVLVRTFRAAVVGIVAVFKDALAARH